MTDLSTFPIRPLDTMIREHVLGALSVCNGNKQKAAQALGVARSTLYRMLIEWGVR